MINMENQLEQLTLECYLQLKQSQKIISENLFKSKERYFQEFPEIYYALKSINILIPLRDLELETLDASDLETLMIKIAQDPHRSWITFVWVVPEGYLEDFEAYLNFIDPELYHELQKNRDIQILDLPDLQHYWWSLETRIDAYWDISQMIDQAFMCWNTEDQYAESLTNLPKIYWSDDRPVTACLYESLLQKIEQLDLQANAAFARSAWEEAIDLYETIVSLNPLNPNNWANLGSSYFKQGNYQKAKESLEQAIVLNPKEPQHLNTLGLIYENLQQHQDAITAYRNAIQIAPKEGNNYCDLGSLLIQLSQYLEAEKIYQEGLEANPWYYGLYLNLGNLWVLMGKTTEAIRTYQKAKYLRQNDPSLYFNLSIAQQKNDSCLAQYYYATSFKKQDKYHEALSIYENIIKTNPLCPSSYEPEVHIDYIDCLKALRHTDKVLEIIRDSINILINQRDIFQINLLFIRRMFSYLNDRGEHQQSQALARELKLLSLPAFNELYAQLNFPVLYHTESEIVSYRQHFIDALNAVVDVPVTNTAILDEAYILVKSLLNFYSAYQNYNEVQVQKKASKFIHNILIKKFPQSDQVRIVDRNKTKKIKIGYLSNHLQDHSATLGILGWIENHNSEKFEYFLYHVGMVLDNGTQKFASASDHFCHICIQDYTDLDQWLEMVTQTIQNDRLDILVFTDVGMDIKSTLLSRLRLAPIQCVLWGHPVTTGSETMDYFVTADLMEPDDAVQHYSEQLVYLPNLSWSYPSIELLEEKPLRSDFQLPDDRILYFSCQSLFKYLPKHDYIYPAIAQRVPQAYFMFLNILEIGPIFWQRLEKAFAAVDLDVQEFCKILPRQSYSNFLALQELADIYLDTLSWSGGNTTLQALACGIPVVTCPNQFMRGRHSYGILQTLGVTETIAHNEQEYIDIACELGLNPQWRSSVVEKIKARNHRLYNDLQCVEAVENFFEYAYQKAMIMSH